MAKKKCVRKGRSHGRTVCRKFSGGKGKKASTSRSSIGTAGLSKAIRTTSRKACSNPDRNERSNAILRYIQGAAENEIARGVPALGKTVAKRKLAGLHKALRSTARLGTKCVMAARRRAARAARAA